MNAREDHFTNSPEDAARYLIREVGTLEDVQTSYLGKTKERTT